MDEGGRKQMTFILKDGLIHIVGNHGLPNNNIEGTVVSEGLEGYTLHYSVNNKDYQLLKEKITITKEELKNTSIKIIVRAIKDKEVLYFKSDIIPLTHAIILGKNLEDSYPEVIKLLLKRMAYLEEYVGIEMKGTKDELHKNMLDIVETFEEINRKGSLF
jgi:hypothetical protein